MAEKRKHEETVRRFQEMFDGSLGREIIQRVLQKNLYNPEKSLTELLEEAESNRDRENSQSSETKTNRRSNSAQMMSGSVKPTVSPADGSYQSGLRSPAGVPSQYTPQALNPSMYNFPYGQQSLYHPQNFTSAPQGYQYPSVYGPRAQLTSGGPIPREYGNQPGVQDQVKKPRVEHYVKTSEQPLRQSVGSNVRGRGVVESQTGGSLHRSASEHPGGGRQWSDVTRRPGNGQYWKLSSSRGRSNDWRRLEQDTSSSGKLLVIIRGLPGSGKTTLARQLAGSNGRILSTDDFFCGANGQYVYDVTRIGEAHDWNQKRAEKAMSSGESPVIIDNTNCMRWEMKPYAKSARRFGYRIELREPETDWKFNPAELARRNVHGVPLEKIQQMLDRYEHNVTVNSIFDLSRPASISSRFSSRTDDRRPVQRLEDKSPMSFSVSAGKSDVEMPSIGLMPSFNPALLRSGSKSPPVEQKQEKEQESVSSHLSQQERKGKAQPQVEEDKEDLPPLESYEHLNVPDVKEKPASFSTCFSSASSILSTGQSTGEVKHPVFNSSLLTFGSNPLILPQQTNVYHLSTPHFSSGSLNSINQHFQSGGPSDTQPQISGVPASPLHPSNRTTTSSNRLNSSLLEQGVVNPTHSTSSTAAASTVLEQPKSSQGTSNPVDTTKQPLSAASQRPKGETGGPKYQRPMAAIFPAPSSTPPTHSSASYHGLSAADPLSPAEPTPLSNSPQHGESSSSIQKRSTGNPSILASLTESLPPQAPSISGALSNQEFFEMLQTELENQPDETDGGLLDQDDDLDGRDGQADDDYKEFTRLLSDAKRNTTSMTSRVIDQDIQQSASHEFVDPRSNMGVSPAEVVAYPLPTAPTEELSNTAVAGAPEKTTGSENSHEHTSDELPRRRFVGQHHENEGRSEGAGLTMEVVSIAAHGIDIPVHPGVYLVSEGSGDTRVNEQSLFPHSVKGDMPSISSTRKEKSPKAGQTNEAVPAADMPAFHSPSVFHENPKEVNPRSFHTAIRGQPNDVSAVAEQASGMQESRVSENPPTRTDHPQIVASLDFLTSCFPDLDRSRLRKLLQDNQFNVELTINVVLQEQATESSQHMCRKESDELTDSDEGVEEMSNEDEEEAARQKDVESDPEEQLSSGLQGVITNELDAEIAHSLNIEEQPTAAVPLQKKQIHLDEEMARKLQAEFDSEALPVNTSAEKAAVTHEAQVNDAVGHPPVGVVQGKSCVHGAKSSKERSKSPGGAAESSGIGRICLRLDVNLVQQMQQMFGQVSFPLTPDDYVVELGDKFSRKLYRKWVVGLEEKYDFDGTLMRRLMQQDEILAKKLQAEEEKLRDQEKLRDREAEANKASQNQGAKRGGSEQKASGEKAQAESFSQIVDEQFAVELGKKERPDVGQKPDLAGEIKRRQLHAMFPTLDKGQLDEIFSANDFAILHTVQAIKASCGLDPMPTALSGELLPAVAKPDGANGQQTRPYQNVEVVYQQTATPEYQDFRAEAELHARQREDCFRKAAQAFQQKRGELAQYYSNQGHLHTEKMLEANRRASRLILTTKNVGNKPLEYVDLHGLHVTEALEVLKNTLACIEAVDPPLQPRHLTVVTGRGKHSEGGKARLKPAVQNYLKQQGYRFSVLNAGTIKITL